MDNCNGGITVVMRYPGYVASTGGKPNAEELVIDCHFPTSEIQHLGQEKLAGLLTCMAQIFAEDIVTPHVEMLPSRFIKGDLMSYKARPLD